MCETTRRAYSHHCILPPFLPPSYKRPPGQYEPSRYRFDGRTEASTNFRPWRASPTKREKNLNFGKPSWAPDAKMDYLTVSRQTYRSWAGTPIPDKALPRDTWEDAPGAHGRWGEHARVRVGLDCDN